MRSRAKMSQCYGGLGQLQPRGIVGIPTGKHYDPVPIDNIRGRQRQLAWSITSRCSTERDAGPD